MSSKFISMNETLYTLHDLLQRASDKLVVRESMNLCVLRDFHVECKRLLEHFEVIKHDGDNTGKQRRFILLCLYARAANDVIESMYNNDYEIRESMRPVCAYYHLLTHYYGSAKAQSVVDTFREYLIDSIDLFRIRFEYMKRYLEPLQKRITGNKTNRAYPLITKKIYEDFAFGKVANLPDTDWDSLYYENNNNDAVDDMRTRIVSGGFTFQVCDMPIEVLDDRLLWRVFDERMAPIRSLNRELDNLSKLYNMYLPSVEYDRKFRECRVHYEYQENGCGRRKSRYRLLDPNTENMSIIIEK